MIRFFDLILRFDAAAAYAELSFDELHNAPQTKKLEVQNTEDHPLVIKVGIESIESSDQIVKSSQ